MFLLSFRWDMVSTPGNLIKVKSSHYNTAKKEDIKVSIFDFPDNIFRQDMNKQIQVRKLST